MKTKFVTMAFAGEDVSGVKLSKESIERLNASVGEWLVVKDEAGKQLLAKAVSEGKKAKPDH